MSAAENLQYESFYYIKLNPDSKLPATKWGGYGIEPEVAVESDDPDVNLYTHEQVVESDHDSWGIAGVTGAGRSLLIYDLDMYKADDFDPDDLMIDGSESVGVVKSPSGGLHVYTIVYEERAEGSESNFSVADELPFDIDIRGSFVKAHVVAPNAIPGVGGEYELTNDVKVMTYSDVRDSCDVLKFADSGEPVVEYDVRSGVGADFAFDRAGEAPDEMPACYHRGLQLRAANPDDHPNTHKVNSLTAMCGLAAGYSVEEMIGHFCDDFPPGANVDRRATERHLKLLATKFERGDLVPPSVSTLREWGVLDEDESCTGECSIEYHGSTSGTSLDVIDRARSDGGTDAEQTAAAQSPDSPMSTTEPRSPDVAEQTLEEEINDILLAYADDDEMGQKTVVHRVALSLVNHESFVYPAEDARGWRTVLYRFDDSEGIYLPDGERYAKELCERLLGDFLGNHQVNEIIGKIRRMCGVDADELETEPHVLVCDNGVIDMSAPEGERLHEWSPDFYHRTKIPVEYHPDAECPRIDDFFHDIVEPKDVRTLYQLVAHSIYREYAAERAAMLVGDGRNGKSVFLELVEEFLGAGNVTHRSLQDLAKNDFAASDLEGKLANFHPDMGDETVKDLGTFKKLTGRDTMMADVKYEKPVKFENYATMIFAANNMPQMAEDTHALWRRWIYINFPNTFEPGSEDFVPKRVLMRELTADSELQGLLARCVEEISEWWHGREWFDSVLSPEKVREKMKRASEPIFDFATVCLTESEGEMVPKKKVRECYRKYAREEDLPGQPDNVFGERIMNIRDLDIETGQMRINGSRVEAYKDVDLSPRGRQVLGLDDAGDEQQADLDSPEERSDDRNEKVIETLEALGGRDEPVGEGMIFGRATAHGLGMKQAEYALNDLKDAGAVYSPADADENEYMLT